MKEKFLKLEAFGTYEELTMVYKEKTEGYFSFYEREIDCYMSEVVRPVGLPKGYAIVVDECGYFRKDRKINIIASVLYGIFEHGHPIIGNVLIGKIRDDYDGYVRGLTEEDIKLLSPVLTKAQEEGRRLA